MGETRLEQLWAANRSCRKGNRVIMYDIFWPGFGEKWAEAGCILGDVGISVAMRASIWGCHEVDATRGMGGRGFIGRHEGLHRQHVEGWEAARNWSFQGTSYSHRLKFAMRRERDFHDLLLHRPCQAPMVHMVVLKSRGAVDGVEHRSDEE